MYIVGEDFVSGHPQACLSALGSQARTVLFSVPSMGRLWVQSHIGKRCAPLILYKPLEQACDGSGTLMLAPRAYKV